MIQFFRSGSKMAAVTSKTLSKFRPRMLVVDDEPAMLDLFRDLVAKAVNCQPIFASTLSDARAVMAQQGIDLLGNDLINAYGELSRSFETVRLQEGYSQFISKANGLEQLLCHTMDWLLRQVGYCNIGIWLASAEHDLQLGAFMKYTIAAEPPLMEALQKNLLKLTMRRGFLRLGAQDLKATLTPAELKYLAEQEVLAINCTYLGESLAVMALFRDHNTPFSADDVSALKTMSPLFGLSLARAVRSHDGESDEPHEGNNGTPPPSNDNKPKKKDPADWWKNGEAPPF